MRRLYDWMLSFSYSRFSTTALFFFAFIEAIFFPIPPFVLQIPMSLERRTRTWWYALVTTLGSVLGGAVGYELGLLFSGWFREHIFSEKLLNHAKEYSDSLGLLIGGAIAVHPYKLYTVAAGIFHVPFWHFMLASFVGRGVLFFGIGALLYWFGPPVKTFIEKYFTLVTIIAGVAIIAAFIVIKLF
jgi:membrane protein YqaA with SNARE-associated domain